MNRQEALNDRQWEAVRCTEGPLLVLAGAGSGKTRVLTHRIAYLIEDKGVSPWNILAITFTNKAAAEMKERVGRTVSEGADSVWVSTFHSACARILRRHCENLGYDTNFTIYDADDQKTLMHQIFKRLNVDTHYYKERDVLNYISSAKDKLWTPDDCEQDAADFREEKKAGLYREYQKELRQNNAMDFDDLIVNGVELFRTCPEIRDHYQERFRYIMVDEYQDTNHAQFQLVALLAEKYRNLCVVGDDDQSIYRFRGADVTNILDFESVFPGARVVKLEQNYRSTANILHAANAVIGNNRGRKKKTLWTANEEGSRTRARFFLTAEEEAGYLVNTLARKHEEGRQWKELAVLYRTNAQSRLLEEYCVRQNVPYRLIGGVNFYQRREIKDVLAYLKTIANGVDDLAVDRIINVPPRGIGQVTVGRLKVFAAEQEMNLYDAVQNWDQVPGLGRSGQKIRQFVEQIDALRRIAKDPEVPLNELIQAVLEQTGYTEYLKEEGKVEAEARMENIDELISKAASYSLSAPEPDLDDFLEQVALVADVDRMDEEEDRVTLMTLHSAKGLEFPVVCIAGMEEGLFPNIRAVFSENPEDIEEERRLCYVGITRARKELLLTGAKKRMIRGSVQYYQPSRFVREIPEEYLDAGGHGRDKRTQSKPAAEWPAAGRTAGGGTAAERPAKERPAAGGTDERSSQYSAGAALSYGNNPGFGKVFAVTKAKRLDYKEGDRVRHERFGEGVVQAIVDKKKDYEVTVCFDQAGVRRMFANFARLQKIESSEI